eukprot:2182744-Alexandrium_andersonii.AAC.1
MDAAANEAAEAASAAAVGLPVEGWLAEALHGSVVERLEKARHSTDVDSSIRSAVEAAQQTALPADSWTDFVQHLS